MSSLIDENKIPKGWEIKTLGEIGEVFSGSSAPQDEKYFIEGTKPFVRTSDLAVKKRTNSLASSRDNINLKYEKKLKLRTANKGSILFPKSGAAINGNNRAMLSVDAFIVSHLGAFYSELQVVNKYVYLFMLTIDLVDYCENPSYPSLKISRVKNINIPFPNLKEQERIVDKIDSLFSKIDKAIALTEESLKQAENLLPAFLKQVFDKNERDGWKEYKLNELVSYDKSKYTESNKPYVGLEHIQSNTGIFTGTKDPLRVKSSTFRFDNRHILYGRLRPYLNKVFVPEFEGHCSTEIFPILTNHLVDRKFLSFWFMSPQTVNSINLTCTGARMPRANMKEILNFKLHIPDFNKQISIVHLIEKIIKQSNQNQIKFKSQLNNFKNLKSSILSKAFSGEL